MRKLLLIGIVLCLSKTAHAHQHTDTLTARPKVALVLSGGGARGAAHIGAIRLIEEMQIPVDCVVGTSMGAIVGALYAIGYTADEMDSLFMTQDWKLLLSNDPPRREQSYARRVARKRYQINIPYEKGMLTENSIYYRDAGIKVRRSSLQTFPKVLARPGLIDGKNLFRKFEKLTYTYHDSLSYDELPREYACVAVDLVTGKEVVLREGHLAESIRASMSIPGVFYPVYKGNQVLVDGGVVNNYPVNVARAMGADVVIGVEVNSVSIKASDLQSFTSIFERLIGTLGTELHERNVDDTDIFIHPPVKRFPVMGFDTINLRQIIDIGYEAALRNKSQLDSLRQLLTQHDVIRLTEGTPQLNLAPPFPEESEKGPNAYHNPTDQIALGLRIDSEEGASALLSIGLEYPKPAGIEFNLTTRLCANPRIEARISYVWPSKVKANAVIRYQGADINHPHDNNTPHYNLYGADVFISDLLSTHDDLRIGMRYDHFSIHSLMQSDLVPYEYSKTRSRESVATIYALLQGDKYDTAYFPTRGYAYSIETSYNMRDRKTGRGNFGALQATLSAVTSVGSSTALLPSLYTRHLMGKSIPLIYSNVMGGYLPYRYLPQQLPFVGFVGCEFMGHHLTIARLELRQRLLTDMYASGIINYAYSTSLLSTPTHIQGLWGTGLQLSYDTTIGPLMLCIHWNNRHHQFGTYLSFGFEL